MRLVSTAFRNFLIVFIIGLLGFGLLAWKVVVPYIDTELLGDISDGGPVHESADPSESDVSGDVSQDVRRRTVNIALIGKASDDYIAGIFFIHIDEEKGVYLTVNVPHDTVVNNAGHSVVLYSYLFGVGAAEMMQTVPYLVGYPVDYYAVFDYNGIEAILKRMGNVKMTLSTMVRVLNTAEFADEIQDYLDRGEEVPDAYYEVFEPGTVTLNKDNLYKFWNYEPGGNAGDFTVKDEVCAAVFRSLTSCSSLGADGNGFLELMAYAAEATLGSEAFTEYGDIMFANGYLLKSVPVAYDQGYTSMVKKIREAVSDY